MTRKRLNHLIDLVLKCKDLNNRNVRIEIERWGYEIDIWEKTGEGEDAYELTCYHDKTISQHEYETAAVKSIHDPELIKAEEHIKKILEAAR